MKSTETIINGTKYLTGPATPDTANAVVGMPGSAVEPAKFKKKKKVNIKTISIISLTIRNHKEISQSEFQALIDDGNQ